MFTCTTATQAFDERTVDNSPTTASRILARVIAGIGAAKTGAPSVLLL